MCKWLEKHAGLSFVVAEGKRVTKHSKFEGFKSSGFSKLGTTGSAITEIKGSMLVTPSLSNTFRLLQSLHAATICLDALVGSNAAGAGKGIITCYKSP